jgi:excisionase family DNA binding protein
MNKTQKQISVTEAAEIIGCTRGNVLYLIRRGLVKARRIGRLRKAIYAVDAASVAAYAAKPQRTGRPRGK